LSRRHKGRLSFQLVSTAPREDGVTGPIKILNPPGQGRQHISVRGSQNQPVGVLRQEGQRVKTFLAFIPQGKYFT
jgi:hypothetical protein